MNTPKPTVCPKCGSRAAEWICHLCKTVKHPPEPLQPAPAEAWVDIDELDADPLDNEPDPRWDEDQYLDDPRHGQAAGINRDNRGRE